MVMSMPEIQKTIGPRSYRKKMLMPSTTRAASEMMMTRLGPIRSSRSPKAMVLSPATMFAAAPKMITSPAVNPKVPAAITAPKANTPASPSRNRAEARRK